MQFQLHQQPQLWVRWLSISLNPKSPPRLVAWVAEWAIKSAWTPSGPVVRFAPRIFSRITVKIILGCPHRTSPAVGFGRFLFVKYHPLRQVILISLELNLNSWLNWAG